MNQVTLPAKDLAKAIAFYRALGLVLIVQNDHYARFENPSDSSTLSLELRQDGGDGANVYFECDDLDARVADLKAKGIVFDSGPKDKSWRWREAWLARSGGQQIVFLFCGRESALPALADRAIKKAEQGDTAPPFRRGSGGYFATTVMMPTILGWMEQRYL